MLQIRDIMTTEVHCVAPETSLRAAMALLATHHISGAPVVAGGRVVGVVSASDILGFALTAPVVEEKDPSPVGDVDWDPPTVWDDEDEPPARYFTELWASEEGDVAERITEPPANDADPLAEHTVAEVMTPRVIALPPTADVESAAERMKAAEVHRLLVVGVDGGLLGIVTSMDLVRAVADHRIERRRLVFDRPAHRTVHERGAL